MSELLISGINTAMTAKTMDGDVNELKDVEQKLSALLPGIDSGELNSAIREYIQANPSATPAEVLEAVVTQLDPSVTTEQVSALRTEWEQFAQTTKLDAGELLGVMQLPGVGDELTPTSVKDMMAMLVLMMIELFGEEAADQLLEGFAERDNIMALAKEKATQMRTMAWIQLGTGLTSAAISIYGGCKGMKMDSGKAMAFSQAISGTAKLFDVAGQFAGSMIQANIAEIDGKSAAAQIRKETSQKLEDMARDLIKTFMDVYDNLKSQEYQTMSKLSNV